MSHCAKQRRLTPPTAAAIYLLLHLLCAPYAQAKTRQDTAPTVVIHNTEQFNRHLEELALQMQPRTTCVFRNPNLLNARKVEKLTLWYDYSNAYNSSIYPQNIASFEFNYKDNAKLYAAHCNPQLIHKLSPREKKALQEAQNRLAALIHSGMTDEQKIQALHDDLVHRATYSREPKGTCTDILLDGRGTCDAYSRTLWLLCRMAGIPCHIVYGYTTEHHAWNLVRINRQWHHIDATWDDPVDTRNPERAILSHRYFLLSDTQMASDHSWDKEHLPQACEPNENFYRSRKLHITNDSELWTKLSQAIQKGQGSLEVYMQGYGSDADFRRRLQAATYHHPQLQSITAWEGPPSKDGVIHFIFSNAGSPETASTDNLDLTQGAFIETRKLLDKIDTPELQEHIEAASGWWHSLIRFFTSIWEVILSWFEE